MTFVRGVKRLCRSDEWWGGGVSRRPLEGSIHRRFPTPGVQYRRRSGNRSQRLRKDVIYGQRGKTLGLVGGGVLIRSTPPLPTQPPSLPSDKAGRNAN